MCIQEVVPSKPKQKEASRDVGTSTEACTKANAAVQVQERLDAATQADATEQTALPAPQAKLSSKLGPSLAKAEELLTKELEANLHAHITTGVTTAAVRSQVGSEKNAGSGQG